MKTGFPIIAALMLLSFAIAQGAIAATPPVMAGTCYTPAEFEAEQGLRIHSELMVIGLTCLKMPGGSELYGKYQMFTLKNQKLISGYEDTMIAFYKKQGAADPERAFHTMRTGLANGISKQSINNAVGFCNAFGPRIDKALGMDEATLRKWAQHEWPQSPTQYPLCRK